MPSRCHQHKEHALAAALSAAHVQPYRRAWRSSALCTLRAAAPSAAGAQSGRAAQARVQLGSSPAAEALAARPEMLQSWMRRGVTWTMMAGAMHALKMVVSWGHSPTESVTSEKVVPTQKRGGTVQSWSTAESWQSGPGIIQPRHRQAGSHGADTPQSRRGCPLHLQSGLCCQPRTRERRAHGNPRRAPLAGSTGQ